MLSDTQVLPEAMGQDGVLHADAHLRKDAVVGLFLVAVLGSLAIGWVLNDVLDNLERTAAVDPQLAIEWARLLLASAQFPPPGTRVLKDTRIRRGPGARALGQAQFGVGIAIVTVSLLLLVWTFFGLPALVIR